MLAAYLNIVARAIPCAGRPDLSCSVGRRGRPSQSSWDVWR